MVSPILPRRIGVNARSVPPVLHNQTFRRYWLSQIVSMTGTWMQQVAQSLVVLTLTTSALAVGAVGVVGSLPMLVLMLHAGVVADCYNRRIILLATQAALGIFAVTFAALVYMDIVAYWQIIVLALLLGITASFELPASQSFIPELVGPDDLPQAIALNSAAFNGARLIGPALAGVVIAVAGLAAAFVANALSFLAVIGVLLTMRGYGDCRRSTPVRGAEALREGLAYVRCRPHLLGLIGFAGATSLLVFPHITVLLPLYVTEVLGAGPGWVGGLLSCIGLGSLTGALAMLKAGRSPRGVTRRLALSACGVTLGLLGLSLARNPLLAVPAAAVLAFSVSLGMAQVSTRVQQLAPDELRGRITSIHALSFAGVTPFAVLLVSAQAEVVGLPTTLLVCAVGYALCGVVLFLRFLRVRETRDDAVPAAQVPNLEIAKAGD